MGGVARFAAVREEPDDIQVVEIPNDAERGRRQHDGPEQRRGQSDELRPGRSTVQSGRFVDILRDAAQTDQSHDHHEREAHPDIDKSRRGEGLVGRVQPLDRRPTEGAAEEGVHRAVLAVKHAAPRQRRYVLRHGPGQEQEDAPRRLTVDEILVQHDGERKAKRHLQKGAHRRPQHCFAEDDPEFRLGKDERVLPEAGDLPIADVINVGVG